MFKLYQVALIYVYSFCLKRMSNMVKLNPAQGDVM